MRTKEGTQMNLLALLLRISSSGPGSDTEGHGHSPLQMFKETKGILVTLKKGTFINTCGFFPPSYLFSLSLSSWTISHFIWKAPFQQLPLLEESYELFLSGRQKRSNFESILISMALCVSGELH